ncbi:MAG: aspartate-semialdehyde dehydrogenase [Rubritalea sp.]|uniref:aspartate-semialdehyde dehydrogenase n=1 Tax=Rubritalea sp. TaxID=2109375 RepID=UPI003241DEF4
MKEAKHIAIVGATGAVGEEMLACLDQRNFPISELTLLASARSAGKQISFQGKEIIVKELTHEAFEGVDVALFAAGGGISETFAPSAARAGAIVIDNSSAFRMDDEVPLIVPEINPEAAKEAVKGIIANPNCTTIISLMALYPLHKKYGLKSIIASSYQAVSGSGAAGIAELKQQCEALANGGNVVSEVYPTQIAFNVIPQVDAFQPDHFTKEELKMLNEARKILKLPELKVTCTCVRVPVYRSHSVSITAGFEKTPNVEDARAIYADYPGVDAKDDPSQNIFPTPLDTTLKDNCLVGRIREDKVLDDALALWVVGDQVRKGAALNAVQIAEIL